MAVRVPDITARIRVDTRDLARAEKATKGFSSSTVAGFKAAAGAAAAYGALSFAKNAINDAREQRRVSNLTAAALKSTGSAAKVSAAEIEAHAGELAKLTGVDDGAIQAGQNLLSTFTKVRNEVGKGNDIFTQATELGLDMATALGTDASGAALQLGKALNDPIKGVTALSRAGVSFTQQQRDQIKTLTESGRLLDAQKIILGELKTQFGGAAEAAADPVAKLANTMGELRESVGAGLLPIIDRAANALNSMSPEAQQATVQVGGLGIAGAATAIGVGKTITAVSTIKDSLGGFIGRLKESRVAGGGIASMMKTAFSPSMIAGGVALGVLSLAITDIINKKREQAALTAQVAAAQRAENEGSEGATRQFLNEQLARGGLIDSAKEMGIAYEDRIAAANGNAEALAKVRDRTFEYQRANDGLIPGFGGAVNKAESFRTQLGALNTASAGASRENRQLADAARASGDQMADAAPKTMRLHDAVTRLSDAMDRTEEKAFGLRDATSAYEAALDDARSALKDSNGSLDLNSRKGREADDAMQRLVGTVNDLTEKTWRDTKNRKEANDAAETGRARLQRLGEQYGLRKRDIELYTDAVKKIPKRWDTKVSANTQPARSALNQIISDYKNAKISMPLEVYLANIQGDGFGIPSGGSALATAQMAMQGIPGLTVTSTYRPGAITASGNVSYHADKNNPAVDIAGPMASLDRLYAVLRGVPHRELLWRTTGHWDHLHFAHQGGVVSPTWPTLPGLKPNERPVITEVGERIVPRSGDAGETQPRRSVVQNFYGAEVDFRNAMAAAAWDMS